MKKIIKISILVIILGLCISIKSFAASPFRIMFEEGVEAKMGETVEVPLILDSINIDNVAQELNQVKCKITCDENVFEIVGFNTDLVVVNQETGTVSKNVYYNEETKAVVYPNGTNKVYISDRTEIGVVTFKVKDNIETGNYNIRVIDVEASNDGNLIELDGMTTSVYVKGIDVEETKEEEEEYQVEVPEVQGPTVYEEEFKEIKLRIQMKKDGTQLVITPDEVNGGKVGSIKVNGVLVERTDDKYVVATEPNTFYNILVFDVYGNNVYSDSFVTSVVEEETKNEENTNKEDDKKDEEKKDEDKKDEQQNTDKEDTNKEDTNKEDTAKPSSEVKKSPQTGDGIYTSIILLVVATCAWIIAYGVKYVKEQ